MILGCFNNNDINISKILDQKPIWRLCLNWLRTMLKTLPFGRYSLDHNIVTAVYSKLPASDVSDKGWSFLSSVAELHYAVDGFQRINMGYGEDGEACPTINCSESNARIVKASVIIGPSDFLILFPGEYYQSQVLSSDSPPLSKIVISIPVQRIN